MRTETIFLTFMVIGLAWPSSATEAQEPELVQPGVISTDRNETFPTIDPADGSLWFSVYDRNFSRQTIMVAPPSRHGWAEPQTAPFSGEFGDRAARFSPDGSQLYFTSNRPVTPGERSADFNIWVTKRMADGGWTEPTPLPEPIRSDAHEMHNVVTADGSLYVASNRPGGAGRSDIYRFRPHGDGWEGGALGQTINDELSQPDLYVTPDGSWMILVITDRPGGYGGDDLYVSRFENGVWSAPRNLGAQINSEEYEYGPSVSPDGRYLYFASHRGGSADVYRVELSALGVGSR